MVATGIALMPGFRHPPDPSQARAQLGIDPNRAAVLVLGGGLGLGVDTIAKRLLVQLPDVTVLAQTERNRSVKNRIDGLAAHFFGRFNVWDWSEQMEVFLRAANIVVGKPVGLTVAETLACDRPLLATQSLRGQNSFKLCRIQERAWQLGRRDAAIRIADMALTGVQTGVHRLAPGGF